MSVIKKILNPDYKKIELHDILATLSLLVFLGLEIFHAIKTTNFDAVSFGGGVAAILAGMKGASWMASKQRLTDRHTDKYNVSDS